MTPNTDKLADARADEIVTALYRRFKDWSKRGFGPDDVTWCEVKADVLALIALATNPAPAAGHADYVLVPREPTDEMAKAGQRVYLEMNIADPVMHAWDAMLAVAPQPAPAPVQPDDDLRGITLRFGMGAWIVTTGRSDDEPTVFIDDAPIRGTVGTRAPDVPNETVARVRLLLPTAEQAKRVADALVNAQPPAPGEAESGFAEWIAREMPPGTIISDPYWWAPRIEKAITALRQAQQPITLDMIHECEAHLPLDLKQPIERWHWKAEYLNRAIAAPNVPCPCCNVTPAGDIRDDLPAQQPGAQAVAVETVGFVRTNKFSDKYVDWTIEGGIDALPHGTELIASTEKLTDENGFGEVYTEPPPPSLPDVSEADVEAARAAAMSLFVRGSTANERMRASLESYRARPSHGGA